MYNGYEHHCRGLFIWEPAKIGRLKYRIGTVFSLFNSMQNDFGMKDFSVLFVKIFEFLFENFT